MNETHFSGVKASRGPLSLREIANLLAEVGADPDQPGEWHLEFVRRVEAAHGVAGNVKGGA